MRIEFLTSLGIPTPKRKMPTWSSFFMMRQYVVKMSSELVPYLQTSTACVLLFSPGRCSLVLRSFPSFVFAPPCSICSEVAQVGGRWRGRKCEHTPPPHVWFVHLALASRPSLCIAHFSSTFAQTKPTTRKFIQRFCLLVFMYLSALTYHFMWRDKFVDARK